MEIDQSVSDVPRIFLEFPHYSSATTGGLLFKNRTGSCTKREVTKSQYLGDSDVHPIRLIYLFRRAADLMEEKDQ